MKVTYKDSRLHYTRDGIQVSAPATVKNIKALQRHKFDCTSALKLNGKLTAPLYPYQLEGIAFAHQKDYNLLIADSMGVGKSLSAMGCIVTSKAKKVLIVCPAAIKYQWKRNLETWVHRHGNIYVCEGQKFEMPEYLFVKHSNIVIINYNIMDYWADAFINFKWDMMVLDEAHRVKHPQTAVSKAVAMVRDVTKQCIALSGTPLTDRNSDIWNVVRMVNRNLFPSHFAFQQRYCAHQFEQGSNSSRSINMLELHDKLTKSGTMIRRTKKDVYDQILKVSRDVVPLGVTSKDLEMFAEETRKETKWMKSQKGKDRGLAAFKVQQSLEKYLQEAMRLKLPLIIDWITDFLEESDEKLIIGCVHKEKCGDILYNKFKDVAVQVDGSCNSKKKDERLLEFCNDSSKRLLIGNILSVGTGIDGLQHVCNKMAIVELCWSPADIEQLISRLDRNGQTNPVQVSFLVIKDSIDDMLVKMLDRKKKITSEVLDGKTPEMHELLEYMLMEGK